uniref:Uncharacterized protein n=1 Tax=Eptatretus burgeri TaxID=7764 RepID=A0A8C4N8G8_EPTBU
MLAGPKYTRIRSFASDGSPPPDVDQENVCESCMRDCSFSESTESHVALEQDQEEGEGIGEGGEEEEGNRSNSATVFRRRPSSLRRSISEPHLPQPVLLSQTAHGACAEDSDDESTTLCSFLPWLSALGGGRFSLRTLVKDLASFSRLATSDGATSSCASSPGGTQDGSRYTGSGRGFGDPAEDWNRSGSFINKPTRGWLHPR